ncbi:Stk1 family PASTA domain-containing Ser/Thr kinase [Bacillus lacus]|uniref:Serine/threonine-protein kinase PrkC n=1 Tax=Metabacillus lacus TaxID=1983721 RepID=A0A7X2LY90_9BACI|nr:Stk1 family PASTA domain-containing Ser/Thr kinase [Metabacillus lacus]
MLIGKRINGRYKIKEVIGGGGMANVYLAKDVILEREVALKVLRFDFANDDEFIRRFRREAQSATSLAHPNIVSIYDVGEEKDIYYIVMEYVDGTTLKQYIQQKAPLHPREAVNIMEQIVSAIAHAHDNQIVHRDIKPHNILIDGHGNVKVTDFGIAMALSSTTITQTNSVLGTVHYLSPEQARGGLATKKSDIYSLGIVLFELLTGRLPFDGESAISIALKHLQSETPSPKRWNSAVPQSVENIILKATAKDPFYRYESAEALEEDLTTAFRADRVDEKKLVIPVDDDVTKAIPVITDDKFSNKVTDDTLIHSPDKEEAVHNSSEITTKKKSKKKKKKKGKTAKILVSIFLILVLAAVSAFTVLPSVLLPKDIEVPDVSGQQYETAVSMLVESGFLVEDPILSDDEEVPEGDVIRTDPVRGAMAKEGSLVKIYKSSGKKRSVIEDYEGQNIDRVRSILDRRGFANIEVEEVFDESSPGTILDQDPAGGTEIVPSEEEIMFTVSKGPEAVTLRNLAGYSKEAVYAYEEDKGISMIESEEYSDTVPRGQVISQNPAAGESVMPGDRVNVVFSLGPQERPVKSVVKTIDIPFDEEYGEEAGVRISIDDAEHSISDPFEEFTITESTSRTIEFKIGADQKAYYQVMINDKVIQSDTIPYPE